MAERNHYNPDASFPKLPNGLKHVNGITPESVELADDKGFTLANLTEHANECRSLIRDDLTAHTFVGKPEFIIDHVTCLFKFESLILD